MSRKLAVESLEDRIVFQADMCIGIIYLQDQMHGAMDAEYWLDDIVPEGVPLEVKAMLEEIIDEARMLSNGTTTLATSLTCLDDMIADLWNLHPEQNVLGPCGSCTEALIDRIFAHEFILEDDIEISGVALKIGEVGGFDLIQNCIKFEYTSYLDGDNIAGNDDGNSFEIYIDNGYVTGWRGDHYAHPDELPRRWIRDGYTWAREEQLRHRDRLRQDYRDHNLIR